MKTNIKATNTELTSAISEYVGKKLSHIEKKFIDTAPENVSCDVEVGKETTHHQSGDVYFAEFNLHVGGKFYRARSTQSNLYAAIDNAKTDLESEVRSSKTKRETMVRKGGRKIKSMLKRLSF